MFNKSFWAMKQDLVHGHGIGFSLFGGQSITSKDKQSILDLNTALKNGVHPAKAWATTMTNCSIAAQNQARQCLRTKGNLTELANGLQQTTVKAKLATVGLKALSIAGNMLLFAGISMGINALFKGIDYLIHRNEKLQEALEESASEFNETTDEVKELETRIAELGEKIADLQRLADNGTISVADEKQLELLKDENEELERQLALKQAQQAADARDVLKDAKKTSQSTVMSKYSYTTRHDNSKQYRQVTAGEELTLAVAAFNNGNKDASSRIEDMYEKIAPTIEAYEGLIAAGIKLEDEDKVLYEQLKKSQDAYLMYAYNINGTKEAFAGLNEEQQKTVLLNRLIKQGLSEDYAKTIVNSINPEDLDKYWDANFKFTPPDPNDYDSAKEYGKAYAEAWAKSVKDNVQGSTSEHKTDISLSDLSDASDAISSLCVSFKELSDEGYVSIDTISKIKEAVGESVENWDEYERILLSAKEGSEEFNQVLNSLTYTILKEKFGTEGLANATQEQVESVLRENDILNASEVAHSAIAQAKTDLILASYENKTVSYEEAEAMLRESLEAEECEVALARLKIAKILFNENKIDTSADVQQILNLTEQARMSIVAMSDFARAKAELSEGFVGPLSPTTQSIIDGTYKIKYEEASNRAVPQYSSKGQSTKGQSTNSDNSKAEREAKDAKKAVKDLADTEKQLTDAKKNFSKTISDINKEQKLADFKHGIELVNQELEKFGDELSMLDNKLDLTFEGDYISKMQTVGTQLKIASEYGVDLRTELNNLLGVVPASADEAEELANQLENLGDKYYENQRAIIEYRNELFSNKIGMIAELSEMSTLNSDRLTDMIDRTKSIMENGSVTGDMWDMMPLLGISKSAVDKQRQENDELIEEEKRYREQIASIRKQATIMSKQEDDAERAEKRQEAYDNFNETISGINEKIVDITDTAKEYSTDAADTVIANAQRASAGVRQAVDEMRSYAESNGVDVNVNATTSQNVNAKAKGGLTTGTTLVNELGREGYIGYDNKLHWFENGSQLFNAGNNPLRVISADDMQKIIKYTGNKYFNEPIGDISKVTAYKDGNTDISFKKINTTKGKNTSTSIKQVDDIIKEVQNAFDNMDISLDKVKEKVVVGFNDKSWSSEISKALEQSSSGDIETGLSSLVLQQSSWKELPTEIQDILSDSLSVTSENWEEWISSPDNALSAVQLCHEQGMSSWDMLSPTMVEIVNEAGIDTKEMWDNFVKENPLQALQLLISSWDTLKAQIEQYMLDMITIATNGAKAIHDIKIEAPSISQESWDNLQTTIANKIQEVINLINETFGDATVDLNFAINTQGGEIIGGDGGSTNAVNANANTDISQFGSGAFGHGRSALIAAARSQVGYTEGSNNANKFSEYGVKHGYAYSGAEAWCNDFVSWAAIMAGLEDSIPLGAGTQDTSSRFGSRLKSSSSYTPKVGDIAYYGDPIHHVEIVSEVHSNGTITTIGGNTGNGAVVERVRSDYPTYFGTYYTGTSGAKAGYATVGDGNAVKGDFKTPAPELIFKKSGGAYLAGINGTEVVKLDAGDTVVPHEETARMLKGQKSTKLPISFNSYAKGTGNTSSGGTTIDVPDGLGKVYTYMNWDTITNMDTAQGRLIQQAGKNYDANGYGKVGERYALAMTSTFGSIGDYVDVYMSNGRVIHGIIVEEKSQKSVPWDRNPANEWGHANGQRIVEWVTNWQNQDNPPSDGSVLKVVNLGNYFGNPSFAGTSSEEFNIFIQQLEKILGRITTNTNTGGIKFKGYRRLSGRQPSYDFETPFTNLRKRATGGIVYDDETAIVNELGEESVEHADGTIESLGTKPTLYKLRKGDKVYNAKDTAYLKKYLGNFNRATIKKLAKGTFIEKTFTPDGEIEVEVDLSESAENAITESVEDIVETTQTLINKINPLLSGNEKIPTNSDKYTVEQLKLIYDQLKNKDENEKITADKIDGILGYANKASNISKWLEETYEKKLVEADRELFNEIQVKNKAYDAYKNEITQEAKDLLKHISMTNPAKAYGEILSKTYNFNVDEQIDQAKIAMRYTKNAIEDLTEQRKRAVELFTSPGVTASMQAEARKLIEDLDSKLSEQQKKYNEFQDTIIQAHVNKIEIADGLITNEISYLRKSVDKLSTEYGNATDILSRGKIRQNLLSNYNDEIAAQERRKAEAHQRNLNEIYGDNVSEDYKWVRERILLDEGVDANGELNSIYTQNLALMNSWVEEGKIGAELVKTYTDMMSILSTNKKIYYDADNTITEVNANIVSVKKEAVDESIELYTKLQEKMSEKLERRLSKQQSEIDAKKSLYDFQQTLLESKLNAQMEITANKELENWLDPETRKLLFNDDDYSEYISGIERLNNEIYDDYVNYMAEINSLTPEEQYREEEITAQWERQLAIKQEELGVLKDEMNVAKKTAEYNNAAKERDTQIILGNRVVNVADPERLHTLAQEKVDLENQASLNKITNSNNSSIRGLEALRDVTQTQINAIQQRIDMIGEMTEEEREAWAESLPDDGMMEAWLTTISGAAIRWMNKTMLDYESIIPTFDKTIIGDIYNAGIDYQDLINRFPEWKYRGFMTSPQEYFLKKQLSEKIGERNATSKPFKDERVGSRPTEYGSTDRDKGFPNIDGYVSGYSENVVFNRPLKQKAEVPFYMTESVELPQEIVKTLLPNIDGGTVKATLPFVMDLINKRLSTSGVEQKYYNIGDVIITQPINNAEDIVREMVNQVNNMTEITNNMSNY